MGNGEATLDCNGVCEGTSAVNECGECKNSSDPARDSCLGCDHEAYSGFELNPCALCVLAKRSDFATYGQDCAGICSGEHEIDACGECLTRTDTAWDACVGCDGVANSQMSANECGMCISTDDANFEDYGRDCTNECARTAAETHYVDECGQCLLTSDGEWNACVEEGGDTQNGEASSDEEVKNLVMIIVGVCVMAVVLLCCGVFCIGWLCRKHREMNRTIKAIKEVYDPMEDNGPSTQSSAGPQVRGGLTV